MTAAILGAVLGAVFGGAGLVGLVFAFVRRFIDNRLNGREAENAKRKATRLRRLTIEEEMEHATGRLLFFFHKAIVTGVHNGDLEEAWQKYLAAEDAKKKLDREILAENQLEE